MFHLLFVAFVGSATAASVHDQRIVGGEKTTIEAFPHQVSLRFKDDHACGGSILTPNLIITAAHCLPKEHAATKFSVLAGSTRRLGARTGTSSVHSVKELIRHPNSSLETLDCDVGFVVLREPIQFRESAQSISLVPITEPPKQGDILLATGWGFNTTENMLLPDILQVAVLPVIDISICRAVYRESATGMFEEYPPVITDDMFCAGGKRQSTYKGDSGGPVITQTRQLVGLTSWGPAGDPLQYPKVFTNMAGPQVRLFVDYVLRQYSS